MKTKVIEILIVAAILAVALAVVFAVGCEEKIEEVKEPNETFDPNLWIDWEQKYPIDIMLVGKSIKSVTFKLGGDHEIVCDGTLEKFTIVMYESMSGKEPTGEVTLRFKEPSRYFCAKCNKEIPYLARMELDPCYIPPKSSLHTCEPNQSQSLQGD